MNSIIAITENFTVDVAPDMSMYGLLRNQSYQKSYALAEFIDNSIQAYLDNRKSNNQTILKINIKFYSKTYYDNKLKNSIVINDNAGGITKVRLKEAFKPANLQLSGKKKGLNEFGIGMKASAVWFTDSWSLDTVSTADPSVKYTFEFDLNKLIANNQKEVEVKQSSLFEEYNPEYGTNIRLHDLREPIDHIEYKQICSDLAEFYQRYILGGNPQVSIVAYYDDIEESLNYDNTVLKKYLCAPFYKESKKTLFLIGGSKKWYINIDFNYLNCRVTGFLSILEKGSYSNPGIVMFRHNRVIIGLTREPILLTTPNKYARQRVYGELNMDEFEVSFTKDAFKFDLSKFLSYIKGANSEIELLLSQAENYRTNLTEEEKNKAIQLENQAQIKEYFAEKKQMQQNEPQSDPVQITNSPNKQNNPDKIIVTNIDENITSQNTEVSKKDTKLERLLIIKEILREDVELETSTYCKLLISQINRAYKYKKLYSELIVAVLRNILENHVDHCYDNLSLKSVTKFQDKLDALLDIIRNVNKQDLTKITTELTQNYTNTTFASHQTLDNLFKASFNKSVIDSLVSALHLTAHKGTNIISLGYFETNYAKQYNMLLEILGCISLYKNC